MSTDSLRDQVSREIHSLRTQLAKSQAVLAALVSTLHLISTYFLHVLITEFPVADNLPRVVVDMLDFSAAIKNNITVYTSA